MNEYDLEDLPNYLVARFYELSEVRVVERDEDVFTPHEEFIENLTKSEEIYGYASVFFPEYVETFLRFAEEDKKIEIVVNGRVFSRIVREYRSELEKGICKRNVSFYVSKRDFRFSFVVTDKFFSISFYRRNGFFDYKRDFVCFSEDCLRWGRDLFNYVKDNSVRVDRVKLKELVRSLRLS